LVEIKAATVQAANKEQKRLYDFSMRVSIKRPQDVDAKAAAAASGVVASQSLAASAVAAKSQKP
jgi:type IV pilus assembly protein PilN